MDFKSVALLIQSYFMRFDSNILRASQKEEALNPFELPPVFIVGAPRSGTTLIWQYLLVRYKAGYISNINASIPLFLSTTLCLQECFNKLEYTTIKDSHYGYINGLFSPNEGGRLCEFWFSGLTHKKKLKVRQTFLYIVDKFNSAIIHKNIYNSLRIPDIQAIFPEARFVFVKRNPMYNAQSIIRARKEIFGDERHWFSVKPPGFDKILSQTPAFQALWQVQRVQEIVDAASIDNQNIVRISYEDFCDNPEKQIHNIAKKFGFKHKNRRIDWLKDRNRVKVGKEDWESIRSEYFRLYGKNHKIGRFSSD